jgi:RimJ/RimL family protein N-acetyltransferase
MIETARLWLRPFRDADRDAFAAINADPHVSDWLGGAIDRAASDAFIDRSRADDDAHGCGCWGVERRADGRLVGMVQLSRMDPRLPPAPAIEIAWQLAYDCWGQGLASEGAGAALDWGFVRLGAREILALTAAVNLRSRAVMDRIGMVEQPQRAFDHPRLAADHALRRHVVYAATQLSRAGMQKA